MKNAEIVAAIRTVVDAAETMRNAYFFTPPGSAGGRRSYERYHSAPRVDWNEGGHEYSAEYTVTCSCANVYAFGTYTRDGKKTTLTAIRNSLRRLEANA